MSFPRAKIQRFNDVKPIDCSPSPMKYNLAALNKKLKSATLLNPQKFAKVKKSPVMSEANSCQSTPCFQTPVVAKKKRLLPLSLKKSSSSSSGFEELKEKIVECNNKDEYIKELTEQIEEMKSKVCVLGTEKMNSDQKEAILSKKIEDISREKDRIIDDNHQQLADLKTKNSDLCNENLELHQKITALENQLSAILREKNNDYEQLKTKYHNEIQGKNVQISFVNEELESLKKQYQQLKTENLNQVSQLQLDIDKLEQRCNETIKQMEKEITLKEDNLQTIQNELNDRHLKEIEKLKAQYDVKIGATSSTSKIRKSEREKYESLLSEAEAKIRLLEENFKEVSLLTEIQIKGRIQEIEETYKAKLKHQEAESEAILKECQEISEYNIIQTEIEKNDLRNKLAAKETELDDLRETNCKLTEKISRLQPKINEAEKIVDRYEQEQRTYQITISTSLQTIEVLKNRLINSDRDVEQLKEEIEQCERKMLDYERKISELSDQLSEAQNVNDELGMQFDSSLRLIQAEIEIFKSNLVKKVSQFENNLKIRWTELQQSSEQVFDQLKAQQEMNQKAEILIRNSQLVIEDLEKSNEKLNEQNIDLQIQNKDLEIRLNEYEKDSEDIAEVRKKYIDISGRYDHLSQRFEEVSSELNKTKKQQKITKVSGTQTEPVDVDCSCKNATLQQQTKNNSEENTIEEHSIKAKLIKNNPIKQGELFQHTVDLELENSHLSKMVHTLKREVGDLRKSKRYMKSSGNKENVPSPGRATTNRTESPGALKPRN